MPPTRLGLRQLARLPVDLLITASGDTETLTVGNNKRTFRMPHAMTLTAVRANVRDAPAGQSIIVQIRHNGSNILSTPVSINAGSKTSVGSTPAAAIAIADLADDAEIIIDITQVGSGGAGAGLKVLLKGLRTN